MDWPALLPGIALGLIASVPAVILIVRGQNRRARLAERRAQRAERYAEIGRLTEGLAHEIKNPLSTIVLNTQLLSEAVASEVSDQHEREMMLRRVSSIRREAERLGDILQDFRQYAGELHVEPTHGDLSTVVEEMIDFYLPQAEHHGVRLRAELADQPLPIHADHKLLKQAILNLMVNATQAMAPEGPPPPGTDPAYHHKNDRAARELILRTKRAGGACELHVIDTGPGIDAEKREDIFHPYFTTKASGSGLGLPTTKRIIDAHNGTIEVHSEAGKGTDFTIRLPVAPDQGGA